MTSYTVTVKTDNELIAEFMGGLRKEIYGFGGVNFIVYEFRPGNNPTSHLAVGSQKRIDDLEYDKRWSWLMPVVEKIANLWQPADQGFQKSLNLRIYKLSKVPLTSDLQHVYKKVMEFIHWFNSQKK